MNIFISYASAQRELAEPLAHALRADGHEVFFDRTNLPAGDSYHERIRQAVAEADQFVFLVSPQSVRDGSYALTELGLAQARWPRPAGRVLPVMVAPTPYADIPAYAAAVTVLEPQGNLAAEVAARLARPQRPWLPWAGAAALVLLALGAWLAWQGWQQQQTRVREAAEREALAREVQAATRLCSSGGHAAAWPLFQALLARPQGPAVAAAAQADCAMLWLRKLSTSGQEETFSAVVDRLLPVLGQQLATAAGARLGDLHAHLGWGEFLRGRDGRRTDPEAHYRQAVATDANNPFGNAMWAHLLAWRNGDLAQVAALFDAGLASGREREAVRHLQMAVAINQGKYLAVVLPSLNRGRQAGEAAPPGAAALYRRWCEVEMRTDVALRPALLAALSAADAVATIAWLQPLQALPLERTPLWRLCQSAYLVHEGRRVDAEPLIQDALRTLGPAGVGGSYERWALEQRSQLRTVKPPR